MDLSFENSKEHKVFHRHIDGIMKELETEVKKTTHELYHIYVGRSLQEEGQNMYLTSGDSEGRLNR